MVSIAQRGGRRLICVTINDGNDWVDHQTLLEDGFARYSRQCIVEKGQILGAMPVVGGESQWVNLVAAEEFVFPLSADEDPQPVKKKKSIHVLIVVVVLLFVLQKGSYLKEFRLQNFIAKKQRGQKDEKIYSF